MPRDKCVGAPFRGAAQLLTGDALKRATSVITDNIGMTNVLGVILPGPFDKDDFAVAVVAEGYCATGITAVMVGVA